MNAMEPPWLAKQGHIQGSTVVADGTSHIMHQDMCIYQYTDIAIN